MPIGFGRKSEPQKDITLESLKDVEKFFIVEIRAFQEFEGDLLIELREIKDLEHNFRTILLQMESLEKLAKARTEIFQNLLTEIQKDKTKVNIEYCQERFRMIEAIDKQLGPMLGSVNAKLDELTLTQTHALYAKNKENHKKMQKIDEDARKLRSWVYAIQTNMNSYKESLMDMTNRVQRLFFERQRREMK
ncbi:hypothetical protein HZA98_04305 [Candidatus Woesearchaeota archaeon]|nr:hypothetical protein [Candidatus Woesearchaeota archaeon]